MQTSITIDASRFNGYVKKLATALKMDLPDVVRMEAASVLKVAANRTKVSSVSKIRIQTRERVMGRIDDGTGVITINKKRDRGRMWFRSKSSAKWRLIGVYPFRGKKFNRVGWKISDSDWAQVQRLWKRELNALDKEIAAGLASRGLSARSWLDAIVSIGYSPMAVSPRGAKRLLTAMHARPRHRPPKVNGFSSESGRNSNRFVLQVTNTSPLARRNKGASTLAGAIRTRQAAFRRAAENQVFDSARETARLYPGVDVSR